MPRHDVPPPPEPPAARRVRDDRSPKTPPMPSVQPPKQEPYIRITKKWDRNSGFAPYSWMYYVDIVNEKGESCREAGITCHAGQMNEYGMDEYRAQTKANAAAAFFGWPIRKFTEERISTTQMKEET